MRAMSQKRHRPRHPTGDTSLNRFKTVGPSRAYRSIGGCRTRKQVRFIRSLEARTGTAKRDVTGMSKAEASDYIDILLHREKKRSRNRVNPR